MKKIFLLLFSICITSLAISQDVKDADDKMTEFASKTGVIIKFEDYKLPDIKLSYGVAETKIRKLTSGGEVKKFYQISYEGKYGTKTASIAYEDLVEVQKAMVSLKDQAKLDINTSSDYVENKFVTDDGFKIGYYVSDLKLNWYMVLEKYGSNNTIFMRSSDSIDDAISGALKRMDSIN